MKTAATILLCCCTAAHADMVIHSRSCELYHSRNGFADAPFNDVATLHQLGLSGPRAVDLTTFHGEHAISVVSPTEISGYVSASLSHNSWAHAPFRESRSSSLMVVFGITQESTDFSLLCTASAHLASPRPDNELTFTIQNLDTGEIVFEIPWHPTTVEGLEHLPYVGWNNHRWNFELPIGTYLLTAAARPGATFPSWPTRDPVGYSNLSFTLSTAPSTSPAMALIPAPAATLILLPARMLQRRRR